MALESTQCGLGSFGPAGGPWLAASAKWRKTPQNADFLKNARHFTSLSPEN